MLFHEHLFIEILNNMPYVCCHDPESASKQVKVLRCGDYLTFEWHKEAQSAIQDACTPSSRLEKFLPKIEDFYSQAEWLMVIN